MNFLNHLCFSHTYLSFNIFAVSYEYMCLIEQCLPGVLQLGNTEMDAEKLNARLEVMAMLLKIDIPFSFNLSDMCCFAATTMVNGFFSGCSP